MTTPLFLPKNTRDRGDCQTTVHGVSKSWIRLSNYYFYFFLFFAWKSESRSVVSDSLWPPGILHARILQWVAFPFSRGPSQPRDWTQVSCIAGRFFTSWATREAPIILEWVDYPFSSGSSWHRNPTSLLHCKGMSFSNKIKHAFTIQLSDFTLVLLFQEREICLLTSICIWMFIEVLFLIAENWKVLKCSPTCEWLNQLCYIHTIK